MPSLADVTDHAQACDIIRNTSSGDVTIIQGWNSSRFTLTPQDLGDNNPAIVLNLSLHGMVMNHQAGEYLSQKYSDVVSNHMNPLWAEKNLPRILGMLATLAPPSGEQIELFGRALMEMGIGRMDDMLLPGAEWLTLARDFPIPVDFWADEGVYRALTPSERAEVKGVKLFTDGALGTRTASLKEDYLSGGNGLLLFNDDELSGKLYRYMSQGIPVAIHAIGDRAVEQVVKLVSGLRKERCCDALVRIEHAQFISQETAFGAREAGIVLSMQPNFSMDSTMYTDRLPLNYPGLNNPFRMLIDHAGFVPGTDLLFGSDGMPHGMAPALQCALYPPFEGQALTLEEFKAGYCILDSDVEWWVHPDGKEVEILG